MNDAGKEPVLRRALGTLPRRDLGLTYSGRDGGGSRQLIRGRNMWSRHPGFGQRLERIAGRNLMHDAKLHRGKLAPRMRYVAVCLGY